MEIFADLPVAPYWFLAFRSGRSAAIRMTSGWQSATSTNRRKMMKLKHAFPVVVLGLACLPSLCSGQAQTIAGGPLVKPTVLTPVVPSAAPAYKYYAQIQGKLGPFQPEIPAQPPHQGTIGVISFEYQQAAPQPLGASTGRKQLTPLTITKAVGAASPQIRQASTTGEVLPIVTLEFLKPDGKGNEVLYQTLVLKNAFISSYRLLKTAPRLMEEITFTYQQMLVTEATSSTTKQDSWAQPQ
jgi:type VI secretion system Hcp family effector